MTTYVLASVLDRLMGTFDDPSALPGQCTLDAYIASVARDIEMLLNTRRARDDAKGLGILDFGLPDVSGLSADSSEDRATMVRWVEEAIHRHEPRLRQLRVTLSPERQQAASLAFSIKANLIATPYEAVVDFSATFLSTSFRFAVVPHG